jgi:uncharacterized repeat protein (TIGR01451 family)
MRLNDFIRIFMALWLALLMPGLAHAFGATQCAASRFGSDLGCTANDVSITNIVVVGGPASCTGGQNITLDLDVTVQFASPDRWDIGIFISNDGKSPQLLPANGGAASCSVEILPTSSPFLDLDPGPWSGTRDTCGDGNGAIRGGTGNGVLRMTSVSVPCQAQATTGKLFIPFVVSWDNQSSPSGATCTSINDPVPNTKSKCNAPTVAQGSVDVIVLPTISKTDGITSITPGDATTYTITINNSTGITLSTANSNAAVFKDPAVSNLNVSSVTCTASGGATCPAAGTALTVANMQSASGVTIPAMPANSAVVFTVNAQLTGNPTGTLTNVATVTANSQTNSASDADTIVYPGLLNMKTVSVISDPVNGTTNPKNIPGAEVLYTITISNTGLGTVNPDVMTISDAIPPNLELYVGAAGGPVTFTDGLISSNLAYTFTSLANATDDIMFSNNGGSSFTYTPVPNGAGYDAAVTNIRINPKGKMAAWSGSGSYPSFSLGLKARIK